MSASEAISAQIQAQFELDITPAMVDKWLENQQTMVAHMIIEYYYPWNVFVPMAQLGLLLIDSMLQNKAKLASYPVGMANQQVWLDTLTEMRYGLAAYVVNGVVENIHGLTYETIDWSRAEAGLQLFFKHFGDLCD